MLLRIWNLALPRALYLPQLPAPLRWKAEPVILDTGPLPAELYQKLSCTLSRLLFPAGLRGRCSQPHFTVEVPGAQRAKVTFARLQGKLVAELPWKPRCPSPALGSSRFFALPPAPTAPCCVTESSRSILENGRHAQFCSCNRICRRH